MSLRLKNGFNQMADALLETRSFQIVTSMTGNVTFSKPVPTVEVVHQMATDFFEALSQSADGSRLNIAIKNQKRAVLITALHQWSRYVLFTANGDVAKALESGFQIAKTPGPTPPLSKPETPTLQNGINPGELISSVKPMPGAISYLHQYATEASMAQGIWQTDACSKSSCVLTGLASGTKYYCRIAVVGRKEQIVYSDVVTRIAA